MSLGLQDHSALLKQLKKNAVVKKIILKITFTNFFGLTGLDATITQVSTRLS